VPSSLLFQPSFERLYTMKESDSQSIPVPVPAEGERPQEEEEDQFWNFSCVTELGKRSWRWSEPLKLETQLSLIKGRQPHPRGKGNLGSVRRTDLSICTSSFSVYKPWAANRGGSLFSVSLEVGRQTRPPSLPRSGE